MSLESLVTWLGDTKGSIALHESLHLYTYVEAAHVLGITLFAGTIAMVDLRLLGVSFKAVPVSQMNARILPWTVAGFVLMIATGVVLFYAIPVRTFHSPWFRLKMILMVVAAVNIAWFTFHVEKSRGQWDTAARPPAAARTAAVISLVMWIGVIVTGRMIAYNWLDCDKPQPAWVQAFASCKTMAQQ